MDLGPLRLRCHESGGSLRYAAGGNQNAARVHELFQYLQRVERNPLYIGEYHRFVFAGPKRQHAFFDAADLLESLIIEEVKVESGVKHCGDDIRSDPFAQGIEHVHPGGGKACPGIAVRQVKRDVVRRLSLPEQEADALQIVSAKNLGVDQLLSGDRRLVEVSREEGVDSDYLG